MEEESALAYGILDRSDENVIGTGIGVVPKSSSPDFNEEVSGLWDEWTSGKEADVRRTYSFGQLQRLAHRHQNRDGDGGFVLIDRTDEGMRFPELQFVGNEHIETPSVGYGNRSRIIDGIEYSESNAPLAYWIRGAATHHRVLADDFVFLHTATRYNVGRGTSKFHGLYRLFDQIEGFIEAVVVASRVGASQALIVKRNSKKAQTRPGVPTLRTERADGELVPAHIIEPGMINFIDTDGEDVTGFNPQQPQTTFDPFLIAMARILGLKFGLTVQRVLLIFEGLSYSGARATTLQEMQAAWPAQDDFNASFLQRVYPWFVDKCVALGYVKTPPPANWAAYEWVPPARPLNDPVKELAGFELAMKLGLEAPEDICISLGWDWKKKLATIKKNKQELADIGIAWPSDAKSATALLAGDGGGAVTVGPDGDPAKNTSPREQVDAYGIGVRAGVVTPQITDEEKLRQVLSLPAMSQAARDAWEKDGGVRRPITITGVEAAATSITPEQTNDENANK